MIGNMRKRQRKSAVAVPDYTDEDAYFMQRVVDELPLHDGEKLDFDRGRHEESDEEPSVHLSGCARTEGYYKLDESDKAKYAAAVAQRMPSRVGADPRLAAAVAATQVGAGSRTARANRLDIRNQNIAITLGTGTKKVADRERDLIKYNQLKSRKKRLKFERSTIHEWGLFALEPITSDDMVIEVPPLPPLPPLFLFILLPSPLLNPHESHFLLLVRRRDHSSEGG